MPLPNDRECQRRDDGQVASRDTDALPEAEVVIVTLVIGYR
jgi:hypothetical protein